MELYGTPRSHSANLPPYESFNYFQDDIYGSHVTSASRGEKQYEDYAKDYSVSLFILFSVVNIFFFSLSDECSWLFFQWH